MIVHLKDYVNKLRQYSEKLDNFTLLIDQPWKTGLIGDDIPATFIFRKEGNELLISKAGNVEKGKWDYISSMNALMLEVNNKTTLYKQGFFDDSVLILQKEGTDDFQLFINEHKISNTIEKLDRQVENVLERVERSYKINEYEEKRQIKSNDYSHGLSDIFIIVFILGIGGLLLLYAIISK